MAISSIYGNCFLGNKVSDYGIQNHRVDYGTLSKAFNLVLNNSIIGFGEWDLVSGHEYDSEGNPYDIFQYFIISELGAEILMEYTDEIVYYSEEFDIYLWGVTHYGTSWDHVLTDIEIKEG